MADETNVGKPEGENTQKSEGGNPENKNADEKLFSQKELDTHIQSRVKREKDALTTAQKTWDEEKAAILKEKESLENSLKTFITSAMDGLTDGEKKLLGKLPVMEQIEYLNEITKTTGKKTPVTPKVQNNLNTNDNKPKFKNFLGG